MCWLIQDSDTQLEEPTPGSGPQWPTRTWCSDGWPAKGGNRDTQNGAPAVLEASHVVGLQLADGRDCGTSEHILEAQAQKMQPAWRGLSA